VGKSSRPRKRKCALLPWNVWYHITAHVYGSWLRGDPRVWRSRHHREDVDGDYENPRPDGKYDNLYELSKALMKRDPVKIAKELRQFICDAIVEKLKQDGIEVLIVSMDAKHLHVLAIYAIQSGPIQNIFCKNIFPVASFASDS
jgi:hypothetical protein